MTLTPEQKQDLRHALRAALALRHPAALAPRQLQHAVKKELDFLFEPADVTAALEREKPQRRREAAWCLPAPPPPPPRAARDFYALEHRGDARADALLRLAGQRHLATINADAAPASP